jgi:AcrR family transcriptional regulator
MAQYLKDRVHDQINRAALLLFAHQGFRNTSMADIARVARISTGNIYRYYKNKDVLFRNVVPPSFVNQFMRLMRRRVESLGATDDVRSLPSDAAYHVISERLLHFSIENRLRVIIVLGKAEETRYETFSERMVDALSTLAVKHFRARKPGLRITPAKRFCLDQIYRNFVTTMVSALTRFDGAPQIRSAVAEYSKYHLAGLKYLFE